MSTLIRTSGLLTENLWIASGKIELAETRGGGDPDRAAAAVPKILHLLLQRIEQAEDRRTLGKQRKRLFGRHQPSAHALEQRKAELILRVLDHGADRGLTDMRDVRGPLGSAGLYNRSKHFGLSYVHCFDNSGLLGIPLSVALYNSHLFGQGYLCLTPRPSSCHRKRRRKGEVGYPGRLFGRGRALNKRCVCRNRGQLIAANSYRRRNISERIRRAFQTPDLMQECVCAISSHPN